MSAYKDAKPQFYKEIVAHGLSDAESLRKAFPLGTAVPWNVLERWTKRFYHRLPTMIEWSKEPRLVNRFLVGADPEFIFCDPNMGSRVDAQALGLQTGTYAGCDLNGRLAEIRPHPSRTVLEVLASTLDSLRYLYLTKAQIRPLYWIAGAFQFNDGLGGHVHFGKKRDARSIKQWVNFRKRESVENAVEPRLICLLDGLNDILIKERCFPPMECAKRVQATRGRGDYGAAGDVRVQNHGYEYRVFPSWLDSPEIAFLTMTCSKLLGHDPSLVGNGALTLQKVLGMLCYYKALDDDALLALHILQRTGWPEHHGGDFKERWGLGQELTVGGITLPSLFPSSLPPSRGTTLQLFERLLHGATPNFVASKPTPAWQPQALPKDLYRLIEGVETAHVTGMGELLIDLVGTRKLPVVIHNADNSHMFTLSKCWKKVLGENLQIRMQKITHHATINWGGGGERTDQLYIGVGRAWRSSPENVKMVRAVLLSGLFPIWHAFKSDLAKAVEQTWQRPTPGQILSGRDTVVITSR